MSGRAAGGQPAAGNAKVRDYHNIDAAAAAAAAGAVDHLHHHHNRNNDLHHIKFGAGDPLLGNITNDEAEAEIAVETSMFNDHHLNGAGEGRRSARTDQQARRILSGYLHGQLANVAKFGIWWTLLSPTVLALFQGNAVSLGVTRICFNLAMFLFSPLAGFLVESAPVKRVLNLTTILRALLYVVIVPGLWIFLRSGWIFPVQDGFDQIFMACFMLCIFLDGICVTFSNVVDIDCGGTQLVANQHDIYLDDSVRGRYNSIHIAFFDGSMISLCPFVALIGVLAVEFTPVTEIVGAKATDIVVLLALMAVVFFILSAYSLLCYNCNIPTLPKENLPLGSGLSLKDLRDIMAHLYDGMLLCFQNKGIRSRVIFLALETAFEDVVISLIIAEFALQGIAGSGNYVLTNLWANFIVAASKVGAVIAAIIMHKNWRTPPLVPHHHQISDQEVAQVMLEFSQISNEARRAVKNLCDLSLRDLRYVTAYGYLTQYEKSILDRERERVFTLRQQHEAYRPLFLYVLVGSLGALLIPLGQLIHELYDYIEASIALGFLGTLIYMSFSAAPKIGFSSLIQNLIADVDSSGKVYAFIATFLV
eukprot:TRINITY_DN7592_c0_g1_i3.p1 TRINITY_DN7592_c0_g1~~TRINITY_DN7592_c0_g1_i3.p1  ORF type:complete len:591 (+),score=114.29 TRINITY_DN7592_c0_g1_i3:175-1947(+)